MIGLLQAVASFLIFLAPPCLISAVALAVLMMLRYGEEPASASGGTVSVGNGAHPELEDTERGRSCEGRSR